MVVTHFPRPLLPSSSVSNLNMYRALTHAPDAFPGVFPSAVVPYCFVCYSVRYEARPRGTSCVPNPRVTLT